MILRNSSASLRKEALHFRQVMFHVIRHIFIIMLSMAYLYMIFSMLHESGTGAGGSYAETCRAQDLARILHQGNRHFCHQNQVVGIMYICICTCI